MGRQRAKGVGRKKVGVTPTGGGHLSVRGGEERRAGGWAVWKMGRARRGNGPERRILAQSEFEVFN